VLNKPCRRRFQLSP